jgi:hypothetical protein
MTGVAGAAVAVPALPGFPRPRARPRELTLLVAVVAALTMGSLSLGLCRAHEPADGPGLLLYGLGLLTHVVLVVWGDGSEVIPRWPRSGWHRPARDGAPAAGLVVQRSGLDARARRAAAPVAGGWPSRSR